MFCKALLFDHENFCKSSCTYVVLYGHLRLRNSSQRPTKNTYFFANSPQFVYAITAELDTHMTSTRAVYTLMLLSLVFDIKHQNLGIISRYQQNNIVNLEHTLRHFMVIRKGFLQISCQIRGLFLPDIEF